MAGPRYVPDDNNADDTEAEHIKQLAEEGLWQDDEPEGLIEEGDEIPF